MPSVKDIINSQVPIDRSDSKKNFDLSLKTVDLIAESLAEEYDNRDFIPWYCGVIYEFGPSQVEEWRKRALEGNSPNKLFSNYVSDARTYRKSRRQHDS